MTETYEIINGTRLLMVYLHQLWKNVLYYEKTSMT